MAKNLDALKKLQSGRYNIQLGDNNKKKKKEDISGALESIVSLGFEEKSGKLIPICSFKLKDDDNFYTYNGVILSDSIGHQVKVHYTDQDKLQVLDEDLNRWYK